MIQTRLKTIWYWHSVCLIDKSKLYLRFFILLLIFRKGFISANDLKNVFEILGEYITDEEVNTMIKIAGIKSSDKINFKEFSDFFYKLS